MSVRNQSELAKAISNYRKARGITITELAKEWSVPVNTLAGWEYRNKPPKLTMLSLLELKLFGKESKVTRLDISKYVRATKESQGLSPSMSVPPESPEIDTDTEPNIHQEETDSTKTSNF